MKRKIHFSKRKGYKMNKKLLVWFVVWYRKWVLGECRHFCTVCKFKNDCTNDTDWWLDINTLGLLDGDRRV